MSGQTCSLCGRAADAAAEGDPPLGWSSDRTQPGDQLRWICPECSRRYVRSIEAKLAREWF